MKPFTPSKVFLSCEILHAFLTAINFSVERLRVNSIDVRLQHELVEESSADGAWKKHRHRRFAVSVEMILHVTHNLPAEPTLARLLVGPQMAHQMVIFLKRPRADVANELPLVEALAVHLADVPFVVALRLEAFLAEVAGDVGERLVNELQVRRDGHPREVFVAAQVAGVGNVGFLFAVLQAGSMVEAFVLVEELKVWEFGVAGVDGAADFAGFFLSSLLAVVVNLSRFSRPVEFFLRLIFDLNGSFSPLRPSENLLRCQPLKHQKWDCGRCFVALVEVLVAPFFLRFQLDVNSDERVIGF